MSKAVLVSALLAGGALLLAATLFQPSHAPEGVTPASATSPAVAGPTEQPPAPTVPTQSTPSPAAASDVPLPSSMPVRGIAPVPHGPVRLSGYVRVGASERNRGEPVPGAVVRLVPDLGLPYPLLSAFLATTGVSRDPTSFPAGKELGRTVTDERGWFRLEARIPVFPNPISASLIAEKADWSDASAHGGDVHVQAPLERNDLIAYLVPTLVLKGSVADAVTGFPIAAARLEASPSQDPGRDPGPVPLSCAATADAAGRFRLDLGGAREVDLLVSAEGFLKGRVRVLRGNVPDVLRIALAREEDLPSIEGRVTYFDGRHCPEARLSFDLLRPLDGASREPGDIDPPASLHFVWEVVRREDHRAGPDGAFRILLPCGGTWMVKVRCGGFGGKKVVDVAARGATACQVALDEDCRIRVRVVDGAGKPVTANVYLERGGTLSGSTTVAGVVEIGGVPIGEEIRIYAEREGRRSRELRATPRPGGEVFDVGTLEIPPP